MNSISISPNAKTFIDEKTTTGFKLALSSIRCGQTLMESCLKNNIVKIVGYCEDIPFASARIDSVFQLRKDYRGQAWQRQAARLTFSNEGYHIEPVDEENHPNCYLMLDRRELRISNRIYRKLNGEEIRKVSGSLINEFVEDFNIFGSSKGLLCELKDIQGRVIESFGPFAVSNTKELEAVLLESIPYEWSETTDPLVDELCASEKVNNWFNQISN